MSRMSDAAPRLFLALWPPAAVARAREARAADWQWPQNARRTTPERLHATLHFLGAVAPGRIEALRQALAPLSWEGCVLRLDRPQMWPGGIAVLEASTVPPPLARLHRAMGAALAELGMELERRPYRPHVTLARKAQGAQPPQAAATLEWATGPGFVLVQSLAGGRGYAPLQVFG